MALTAILRVSILPWPCSCSIALRGKIFLCQAFDIFEQGFLVLLDEKQVVSLFLLDKEVGVINLGMHGVSRNHLAFKIEQFKKRLECGDLVALGIDLPLGDHDLLVMHQGCKQMHLFVVSIFCSFQGLTEQAPPGGPVAGPGEAVGIVPRQVLIWCLPGGFKRNWL
jgi:hypothetical protein